MNYTVGSEVRKHSIFTAVPPYLQCTAFHVQQWLSISVPLVGRSWDTKGSAL